MKKIFFAFLLVLGSIPFVSCEKDKKDDMDKPYLRIVSRLERTISGKVYYGYTYAYSEAADTTYITYAGKPSGKQILIKGYTSDDIYYYRYNNGEYDLYQLDKKTYSDATKTKCLSIVRGYNPYDIESYKVEYTYDGDNMTVYETDLSKSKAKRTKTEWVYSGKELKKTIYLEDAGKWVLDSTEIIRYKDEKRTIPLTSALMRDGYKEKRTEWSYSGYECTEIHYNYDDPTTKKEYELLHNDKTEYVTHYCYYGINAWMSNYDEYSTYELIQP